MNRLFCLHRLRVEVVTEHPREFADENIFELLNATAILDPDNREVSCNYLQLDQGTVAEEYVLRDGQ